jgi:hypothetical protein
MNEVKLIEDLYCGTKKEAVAAINGKRLWIENKFFVKGNIDSVEDEDGLTHYPLIEALYDNVLLFSDVEIQESENFTQKETEEINKLSENLAVLNLYNHCDFDVDTLFYVEYNFSKIELSAYHDFVANLFHKIPFRLLNINKGKIKDGGVDLIKSLVAGNLGESILIVSKDKLRNMCYDCHILEKIYYRKEIDKELLKTLEEIAFRNHVELEVLDGD